MMKISDIDKNFLPPVANENGIVYYEVKAAPFEVAGLPDAEKNGAFTRLPDALAADEALFWGVRGLRYCTAGATLRFRTDSPVIAAKYTIYGISPYPHFAMTGLAGMDLYVGPGGHRRYRCNLLPGENDVENVFTHELGDRKMREILINFPTYAGLKSILIGVKEGSRLLPPAPWHNEKPICFYGSSITQGCSCTHPGTAYPALVGRTFDAPTVNLGFSGSCKGEQLIADYIGSLSLSAIVYDYDHNTPDVPHLEATHRTCYETIRRHHPDLPIVILSKPDYRADVPDDEARRQIVMATYEAAKARGDRVAFVDGRHVMDGRFKDSCTADGCHPNDLGFTRMALHVIKALKSLGY